MVRLLGGGGAVVVGSTTFCCLGRELTVEWDTTESTRESSASEKTDSLSVASGGS